MDKNHDGFKKGSGCYICQECGKLTRRTKDNVTDEYCVKCEERQMHINSHVDNHFPTDDCGDKDCPIKDWTKKERWWLK